MDADQQAQKKQELLHREMYRLSQDDCMVGNPTNEDFTIEWEPGLRFVVPHRDKDIGWGKGKREVKRYLAEWYCRHMKDHIINRLAEEKTKELLDKRSKGEAFVTKWHENEWLKPQIPHTNDPKLMAEIYPTLFLGVTREFGMDLPQEEAFKPHDGKTPDERLLDELKNKTYIPEAVANPVETVEEPVKKTSKAKLAQEITI